jgi:hypothetical protein
MNKVISASRKMDAARIRTTDKADRATTEQVNRWPRRHGCAGGSLPTITLARLSTTQVLDPRTRMMLFKLLSRGLFDTINGCISTGKEANVYHASSAGMVIGRRQRSAWRAAFEPGAGTAVAVQMRLCSVRSRSSRPPSWCSRQAMFPVPPLLMHGVSDAR